MATEPASQAAAMFHVGDLVRTRDGKAFATVREIRGGYFELDIPRHRDFWLGVAYVDRVDDDGVHLNIDRDQVDEHRLKEPGIEQADVQAPTGDAILSSEEALDQRERMERELQIQRERMGRSADSGVIGASDPSMVRQAEENTDDRDELAGAVADHEREAEHDEMLRERDERIGIRYDQ